MDATEYHLMGGISPSRKFIDVIQNCLGSSIWGFFLFFWSQNLKLIQITRQDNISPSSTQLASQLQIKSKRFCLPDIGPRLSLLRWLVCSSASFFLLHHGTHFLWNLLLFSQKCYGFTTILVIVYLFTKMTHFIPCKRLPSALETAQLFLTHIFHYSTGTQLIMWSQIAAPDLYPSSTYWTFLFIQHCLIMKGINRADGEE